MKILVISHMYPSSFNEVNGIFVHQQVKQLRKLGSEVKVISPVPWTPFPVKYFFKKWKKYSEIPKKIIWEGIEVYYPRFLSFPKALFFTSSGNRMYKGINDTVDGIYKDFKFDIIHSHVALPDGYCGMLIAQKYKKPLVVTIHGRDFYKTIFRNEKCKGNIEKVIFFSTKTIVVSNILKNIGKDNLNIEKNKLNVVPNGIDPKKLKTRNMNNSFNEQYRNKRIFLSVGYLIKRKAHRYVIKALSKLILKYPNIIYLINGDGPEENNLKKLAKKEGLEKLIKFFGRVNHQEVMRLMSSCDIFILPSWNEAFGVVYLEAMANGKPVIACQGEGIDGIIKDKETGILVKPKEVDSLVKAMDYLLSNPDEARVIGKRARKLVLENYTWEKNAEKTIKIYKEALNSEK